MEAIFCATTGAISSVSSGAYSGASFGGKNGDEGESDCVHKHSNAGKMATTMGHTSPSLVGINALQDKECRSVGGVYHRICDEIGLA